MLKEKSTRRTALFLFLIGLAIGIYQGSVNDTFARFPVFLSDLFFTECMVFLAIGVIRLLGNMHAFTSASYGFRFVHKIFRNEQKNFGDAQKAKDEYLKYREEKPQHPEAKDYMILSLIFLVLSLLMIPFAR
ncbi:MAG: DUF3899 domain-containing protein [Clostridia bacterium]|nr:DUF3899 domain-containing protein [Clostridia bacterium]MBR1686350.1 DUF3899 domain-containing protein [Clostridia bacterium]MBR2286961.1 DUF3899 domain-containing protein [Clostridia bacterium]